MKRILQLIASALIRPGTVCLTGWGSRSKSKSGSNSKGSITEAPFGIMPDGTLKGKGGWVYQCRDAFATEPQDFPDAPNHPNFPSAELKPGQTYKSTLIYKFTTR